MMTIIEMTVDEIRETYFYDAEPISDLPKINRTALLAAFDDSPNEFYFALHGWCCEPLRSCQTMWCSPQQLAAVVYSSQEIYLFTFEDLSSFRAGLVEIRISFNRQ